VLDKYIRANIVKIQLNFIDSEMYISNQEYMHFFSHHLLEVLVITHIEFCKYNISVIYVKYFYADPLKVWP